jgi:AraC-like DNA-binding protein
MTVTLQIADGGTVISGYTLSASSSPTISPIATAFDTFVLAANTQSTTSYTLTGVSVSYTAPPVAAPVFSPAAGTYSSPQTVTISSPTSGATIRVTLDGSTPSETHGFIYSGGTINCNITTTIKAIAYKNGFADSPVVSGIYTITQVAMPFFSLPSGSYSSAQTVTISSATSGALIRYTTDGSTPTETNGMLYSGPVSISSTTTLKAIAYETGFTDSIILSAIYTISYPPATAPVFSPSAGTYASVQTVTITSATNGALIRYTADGSTPSETNGTLYTGPVSIATTATLKAVAYENGFSDSPVTSGVYTINLPAAAPTFSPAPGTYTSVQTVTIASATSGVSIRYTTDGSTPSEINGTLYSGSVSIGTNTTLSAIAYEAGFSDSPVTSGVYTIVLPTAPPAISPSGGIFTSVQTVTITSSTSGASIRYTTDGSMPSETNGTLYSGPLSISRPTTIKAIAYNMGSTDSQITSAIIWILTVNITTPANGSTVP